jgi:hypothetical protein
MILMRSGAYCQLPPRHIFSLRLTRALPFDAYIQTMESAYRSWRQLKEG